MSESRTNWLSTGDNDLLRVSEVHVWRACLTDLSESVAKLYECLSSDERERAEKFFFIPDRSRYVVGRSLSRVLLGGCLGIPADQVRFEYGAAGKPRLASEFQHAQLHFNVAHSGDFVLVALAYRCELGIDIERIRTDFDVDEIANQFFSHNERSSLQTIMSATERYDAFFSCWTRKEAYLKARGDGLNLPLNTFDVAFLPGQQPKLIETRNDHEDAQRWTLRDLDVDPQYKAALAFKGTAITLRTWDWLDGS